MLLKRLTEWWQTNHPLFGTGSAVTGQRDYVRLSIDRQPAAIYAIGDVHGCLELLKQLEEQILRDAAPIAGDIVVVMLGDLIDRGPASAQVLDYILQQPLGAMRRICLTGNHESLMLDFLSDPRPESSWLKLGGRQTLQSYGVPEDSLSNPGRRQLQQIVAAYIPVEHVELLESMPVLLETPGQIFVHAGIDPRLPIAEQSVDQFLWYRDTFAETYDDLGRCVVHGHDFTEAARVTENRIAIDTGAYRTGRLTAVRLTPNGPPRIISVTERSGHAP